MPTYYLNGSSLATSTAIFTDISLTICAADGWYSDGSIVRYLSGCLLNASSNCIGCVQEADTGQVEFEDNNGGKYYSTTINIGSTTGAVEVKVKPNKLPKGFRITHDGNVYNKFSSPTYGILESSVSGNYTLMGQAASACDTWASPVDYSLYRWVYNGSTYKYSNQMESVTIDSSDVQLTADEPDWVVLVIPKTTTESTLTIEMVVPCETRTYEFGFEVLAPAALTSFSSTNRQASAVDACSAALTSTFYLAAVTGAGVVPQLYDYVFQDVNGDTAAIDGFYGVDGGASYVQVQNGIVVLEGSCPP